jgi:hypothetical protein
LFCSEFVSLSKVVRVTLFLIVFVYAGLVFAALMLYKSVVVIIVWTVMCSVEGVL